MKSYRPSNGTEGMCFVSEFCEQCIHEKFIHTSNDNDKKCDIFSATMLYDIGEAEYPKEWIYQDNKPICTAFVKFDWSQDDNGNWIDPEPTEPPDDPNQLCIPFDIIEILGSDYNLIVTSKYIVEREIFVNL